MTCIWHSFKKYLPAIMFAGRYGGAQTRNRTKDTRIFSPPLYLLSYLGVWWAIRDLNPGPAGYEPDALTN